MNGKSLEAALELLGLCHRPIPIRRGGKKPFTRWEEYERRPAKGGSGRLRDMENTLEYQR
jgi:hypothetical protein